MSDLELSYQISKLHSFLYPLTKRFTTDRDECLDLVQDTILKALTYKEKFKENKNLKGWLFTIMRNTFINNYRKTKRFTSMHEEAREFIFARMEDHYTANNPGSSFEYNDIWKHVHSLNDELLIPFKLHTAGYKYHEIAEQQCIPIGTVKNRIFTARKEIQKKLGH